MHNTRGFLLENFGRVLYIKTQSNFTADQKGPD